MSDTIQQVLDHFKKVTNGERSRKYVFPNGEVVVKNVTDVLARPSGSHRLQTADGKKLIVSSGWLAIEIDADEWSF